MNGRDCSLNFDEELKIGLSKLGGLWTSRAIQRTIRNIYLPRYVRGYDTPDSFDWVVLGWMSDQKTVFVQVRKSLTKRLRSPWS